MATIFTIKVNVPTPLKGAFADWQAKLNTVITAFPGFVSLEILSPKTSSQPEWVIVQRFSKADQVIGWRHSKRYAQLIQELKNLLNNPEAIFEGDVEAGDLQGGVTEVFITEVSPDKEPVFREWIAKIHQVEAKFPGFCGTYVQSPNFSGGKHWITLLQFDTAQNLDRWLASDERQLVLKESKPLIAAIESHRVISSYAGWFSTIAKGGELPPVWKQTMIVLLVLFPIVMFELKFLSPLTQNFGVSFSTFIGNAVSVTLISWPMMPIAIWFLGWWLTPESKKSQNTLAGTGVVLFLYLLEIFAFWRFL